jgi:calcium-dependent protein kinase
VASPGVIRSISPSAE